MTKQTEFIFDMGDHVKDVISGYEGYVIGRFEFMTGCNHYGIEAKAKDGKTPYESIDEQRLELVEAGAVKLAREYVAAPTAAAPTARTRTSPGRPVPRETVRHA